jgi:hypothetical protein
MACVMWQRAASDLRAYKPFELVNLLWGASQLGVRDGTLLRAISLSPLVDTFASELEMNDIIRAFWALTFLEVSTLLAPPLHPVHVLVCCASHCLWPVLYPIQVLVRCALHPL